MHEIEFAQAEIRKAEDKILEIMEGGELFDRQVKASEAELKTQSAQVEKEKEEARSLTAFLFGVMEINIMLRRDGHTVHCGRLEAPILQRCKYLLFDAIV